MEKGYKRLTPEQPVGLRHAGYVISVQKVIKVRCKMLTCLLEWFYFLYLFKFLKKIMT